MKLFLQNYKDILHKWSFGTKKFKCFEKKRGFFYKTPDIGKEKNISVREVFATNVKSIESV